MPIRNREIADKIYKGIVEQLSTQMPDWVKNVQKLPKDMSQLQKQYYKDALNSSSLEEIKNMLNIVQVEQKNKESSRMGSHLDEFMH